MFHLSAALRHLAKQKARREIRTGRKKHPSSISRERQRFATETASGTPAQSSSAALAAALDIVATLPAPEVVCTTRPGETEAGITVLPRLRRSLTSSNAMPVPLSADTTAV
jgi:hypothetical protein